MKYAKEWKNIINQLPPSLQEVSINYKQWKKRCKTLDIDEALVILKSECDQVEHVFNAGYNDLCHPRPMFPCCTSVRKVMNNTPDAPRSLMLFAQTNSKTLYKVCKRLQKSYENPTPLKWLTLLRAAHEFGFLGGHHTAYLHMRYNEHDVLKPECPLCLNDIPKKSMLIYQCGHHACISCTLQYAKVTHERGMWYNLLRHARRQDCPYCHYDKAFMNVTTV